jgi:Fic family protein
MTLIDTATELKKKLDELRPISPEVEARIMQKFRLDWNYHSNHLEGNTLTFGETKALLLFGITAQGKPLQDHIEITGHDEAIKWISDILDKTYPLNENFIRELHVLLLKESYFVDAITPQGAPTRRKIEVGKYKTTPNHVLTKTGEIFRFASPEETPALMHDLMDWYNQALNSNVLNPILLAAEYHYKFIKIHPFDDGNGRTARILMNFILMQFGYPPVIIKTEDKENYFSALRQADSGILEPFINYITKNLTRSLEIMIAGAEGKNIEESDDFDKELALLEQRFKQLSNNEKTSKSKEAIFSIYDKTIDDVFKSFLPSCEKFNRFYVSGELVMYFPTWAKSGKYDVYLEGREQISNYTEFIQIIYNHKTFKKAGAEFDYSSRSVFEFGLFNYSIKNGIDETLYVKQYGSFLDEDEIEKLVKDDAIRHKKMIESKLDA